MKILFVAVCAAVFAGCLGIAEAETLFTVPVIIVTPETLDFGSVRSGESATNTFLVENAGGGRLIGKASVSAPFKILSGESYALGHKEIQVVTVVYTPSGTSTNAQRVTLTGAGGATATVIGRISEVPKAP